MLLEMLGDSPTETGCGTLSGRSCSTCPYSSSASQIDRATVSKALQDSVHGWRRASSLDPLLWPSSVLRSTRRTRILRFHP